MNFTDQIIANPEGGTVSLLGEPLPQDGYFVGARVSPLIIEGDPCGYRKEIDSFIEYLHTIGAEYLDWWADEDTGQVWVGCSDWYAQSATAERVCRARGEIAFYDVALKRSFEPVIEP